MLIVHKNTSGFSILMAIGTIGLLLIIVTSLAITYMRESKLSRFSYNEVLVSTAAEWAFEYGMLKVRNHKDWFQDGTFSGEIDGNILDLGTPRSRWLNTEYTISASSNNHDFYLSWWEYLIIPLFVSTGSASLGVGSKSPVYNKIADNTSNLNIWGIGGLSWTIVGMSGSQNIAISWTGNISPTTRWNIRIKTSQCYSKIDGTTKSCNSLTPWDDEIIYTYDESKTISDFLSSKKDPYFILFNSSTSTSTPITVNFASSNPFSLPTITLTAISKKWHTSQIFRFIEDKSKYYDALKYGIYNNN